MANEQRVIYSVADLLTIRDDPNRWIVPRMIPHPSKVIVYGKGGSYKSSIIFDLCVAMSSGGLLLRQFPVAKHGPVLLVSTEGSIFDNKERILHHCRAHDVNPVEVELFFCQQPFDMDDAHEVGELENAIEQIKPLLVVLDPLDSFFSGDENSAKETKNLRTSINRLSNQHNTTFLLIHHESKAADLRGSTAWFGWADVILHVTTSKVSVGLPDGPREMVTVEALKQRNGQKGHMFSVLPIIDSTMHTITFAVYDGKKPEHVGTVFVAHIIFETLKAAETPLTNTQIRDIVGVRPEQVASALGMLESAGFVAKDAPTVVPSKSSSTGVRTLPGWRVIPKFSKVDAARALLDDELREADDEYWVLPELNTDGVTGNDGRVRSA